MHAVPLSRASVVLEARRWVGTEWRHQHRLIGVGVDCANLVIAAGVGAGVLEDPGPRFSPWRNYSRTPNPNKMRKGLEAFLVPLGDGEDPQPGDVAWIAWKEARHLPMHLAILATLDGRATIIHSSQRVGRAVEHGFTAEWPDLVHAWYRYPLI